MRGTTGGLDYADDAHPAIHALAHGHVRAAIDNPPLLGPVSIVLRAPVAAVSDAFGGGLVAEYRAGAVVCLLALPLLAAYLAVRMKRLGQPFYARAAAVLLIVFGYAIDRSLTFGHPEEALAGALAVAAVLAALDGHLWWAVGLLFAAAGTKPPAVLAAGPVYFALPVAYRRMPGVRIGAVVAIAGPALIAIPLALAHVYSRALDFGSNVFPATIEWPFGRRHLHRVFDGVAYTTREGRTLPHWAAQTGHLAVTAVGIPLSAAYLALRPRAREAALGLLVVVLIFRGAVEPLDNVYYQLPVILALVTWETHYRRGLPLLSAIATIAVWLIFGRLSTSYHPSLVNAAYLTLIAALVLIVSVISVRQQPLREATADVTP